MHVKIQKWGNSLALRIPKSAVIQSKIKNGAMVDVVVEKGKLIASPVKDEKYSLEKLLSGITKKNLHTEVDFGNATGNEVW